MLRGRHAECERLDQQLQRVRVGQSSVLVLRGEAGVGKTALLDYVAEEASGCGIARAAGVQSEMELPFAGLHQLCAPMLDRLDGLPGPQQEALRVAFALQRGPTPDHFFVALAVLSLLAEAAEARPLVCLVDDAQWLDRGSAQALAFVARRLLAERIAMVFAVREPDPTDALAGLPELVVEGLADGDARALLASALPGKLDERIRDRIVGETHGNPLALLELPRGLTPAELAGGFGLPDRDPLAGRIERSFRRRFESLAPDSRRLLLTAAAEPIGDVTLLWRAAERLGIAPEAAAPAEAAELIALGARVRFRHPLVRSAVYRAAPVPERQEVHRALAEATDPEADPDRRAWHHAHSAAGLDEAVADELERSAGRARGAHPAGRAAARAAAAAARADRVRLHPRQRRSAPPARRRQAARTAGPRAGARELPRSPRSGDVLRTPRRRRARSGRGGRRRTRRTAAAAGVPLLKVALRAVRDEALGGHVEIMRWLLLSPIVQSTAVFELWDDDAFHALSSRAVRLARDTGALALLPVALVYRSGAQVFAGELDAASALIQEADEIAVATGNAGFRFAGVLVAAWRGVEAEAMQLINAGLGNGAEGTVPALAGYATAILNNGLGRYDAALEGARRGSEDGDWGYDSASLPELVEAATRAGLPDVAAAALPRLEERMRAAGTDWALGVLARSQALLSDGEEADGLYREAIERLGRTRVRAELARAHLLYGEWLRREGRRVDAREQLRTAHEQFGRMGAEAFAERARRELTATGETVRRLTVETRDVLTPQETQVARLAQQGQTNQEIGAELFISARTVEYHLHKVFAKLGIRSRKELRAALPDAEQAMAPA